jgi:hypothetical protein
MNWVDVYLWGSYLIALLTVVAAAFGMTFVRAFLLGFLLLVILWIGITTQFKISKLDNALALGWGVINLFGFAFWAAAAAGVGIAIHGIRSRKRPDESGAKPPGDT